jgi:hypothetical protein
VGLSSLLSSSSTALRLFSRPVFRYNSLLSCSSFRFASLVAGTEGPVGTRAALRRGTTEGTGTVG